MGWYRSGAPNAGPITESTAFGETCTPGNQSGRGRALLIVQCFK